MAIPNTNGFYEASSLGRIRSVDRTISCKTRWGSIGTKKIKQKILQTDTSNSGYLYTSLGSNGKLFVHRLVCLAFFGEPPDKDYVVNHKNGNKKDNRIDNLEWTTVTNNLRHNRNCLNALGKKLNINQIFYLIKLYGEGYKEIDLCEIFSLHQKTVSLILRNKMWKSEDYPLLKDARDRFIKTLR